MFPSALTCGLTHSDFLDARAATAMSRWSEENFPGWYGDLTISWTSCDNWEWVRLQKYICRNVPSYGYVGILEWQSALVINEFVYMSLTIQLVFKSI